MLHINSPIHPKPTGKGSALNSKDSKNNQQQKDTYFAELSRKRSESYAHIYGHEQAHQSAAGAFGGGIQINYDNKGIAVSGHVPIHIPGLTPDTAEQRISDYQQIRGAALAPQDPSGADSAVASLAGALMSQAHAMASKKQALIDKNGGKPLTGDQKKGIGGQLNISG